MGPTLVSAVAVLGLTVWLASRGTDRPHAARENSPESAQASPPTRPEVSIPKVAAESILPKTPEPKAAGALAALPQNGVFLRSQESGLAPGSNGEKSARAQNPKPFRIAQAKPTEPTRSEEPAPGLGPRPEANTPQPGQSLQSEGENLNTEQALSAEARLLGQALQTLRQQKDPRRALEHLDDYSARFPNGALRIEAAAVQVDAWQFLGNQKQVLAVLETHSFDRLPRGGELRVLRGELRAASFRCADALADFDHVAKTAQADPLLERALYGLGLCQTQLGMHKRALQTFETYRDRFPQGRFAESVNRALAVLAEKP